MSKSKLACLIVASSLSACGGLPFPPAPDPGSGYDCTAPEAERCGQFFRSEAWASGRVIVTLKRQLSPQGGLAPLSAPQVNDLATSLASKYAGVESVQALGHVNQIVMNVEGLAALARLLGDDAVCSVSADQTLSIPEPMDAQADALSWGLDFIDQRSGSDGQYNPRGDGEGVHVYVIDTGLARHVDYVDRLGEGFAAQGFPSWQDGHGHGTHVGGTVAGGTWGVAKKATLHAAKVLSDQGSGTTAQVVSGVDWMIGHVRDNGWPAAGNMSLGGSADPALDAALCRAHEAGIPVAIAAGNDSRASACGASPARVLQQITVMASNRGNSLASFSNAGSCSDIIAPGEEIRSAWPTGGWRDLSGTSMASPHVAGALALCLGESPQAGVGCIDTVLGWATSGRISGVPSDAPNVFEYVGP